MSRSDLTEKLRALRSQYGYSAFDYAVRQLLRERLADRDGRPQRAKFPWSTVRKLYERQRGICPLCGYAMTLIRGQLHVDHVDPNLVDGFNSTSNLQVTHPSCNLKKGSGTLADWAKIQGRSIKDIVIDQGPDDDD